MVMLATGVASQPGVYALLLGSGVSTGAGLPTGWGVVTTLIQRAAVVASPEDPEAGEKAAADPEQWWQQHGDGQPLGYSNLLASIASTSAARRDQLARFFETAAGDDEVQVTVPSAAHRAVAELVKAGLIRVIITTNFDRLTERALEEAGVPAQVIARPEAVAGMTPLAHARATVIKLHGDYADLQSRNTIEELGTYPAQWRDLLAQIFDEYGLLVSGWSADWDEALVHALQSAPSRRYPLFWDSRSGGGEVARQLMTQRGGHVVPASSADELFTSLMSRVQALQRLSEVPLSTAMAVARLKRCLPDPVRRIDLHDLVMSYAEDVALKATTQVTSIAGLAYADVQRVMEDRQRDVSPLLELLTTGVWHDRPRDHTDLWVAVLQRLLQTRPRRDGTTVQSTLDVLRHYPAALALRAAGACAVLAGRDDVLLDLCSKPTYRNVMLSTPLSAVQALHDHRLFDPEQVQALPRWSGQRWLYPISHLMRSDLREALRPFAREDEDFVRLMDAYDYRVALLHQAASGQPGAYRPAAGEFIGENRWRDDAETPEGRLLAEAAEAGQDWPWWRIFADQDTLAATVTSLGETLERQRAWG